jgi:hypothetical protein
MVQAVIETVLCQEGLVGPFFPDLSPVKNQNPVGAPDRG